MYVIIDTIVLTLVCHTCWRIDRFIARCTLGRYDPMGSYYNITYTNTNRIPWQQVHIYIYICTGSTCTLFHCTIIMVYQGIHTSCMPIYTCYIYKYNIILNSLQVIKVDKSYMFPAVFRCAYKCQHAWSFKYTCVCLIIKLKSQNLKQIWIE